MPNFYNTHYIDHLPNDLLDKPIHVIGEYIANNVYRQAYPSKFPSICPKLEYSFLLNNRNNFKTPEMAKQGSIEREGHGYQHVSRVAINSLIFLNLYMAHGSEETIKAIGDVLDKVPGLTNQEKMNRLIKFLQITAMFHDAGRFGEGEDLPRWEINGGRECEAFLQKIGCPPELAKRFGDAAAKKDDACTNDKCILKKIIQCSDCLDIQRCSTMKNVGRNLMSRYVTQPKTRYFGIHYLDIWRETVDPQLTSIHPDKKVKLQKELIELSLASRAAIAEQNDLNSPCPIELKLNGKMMLVSPGIATNRSEQDKRKYEHGGFTVTHDAFLKQQLLGKWYHNGTMLPVTKIDDVQEDIISRHLQPLQTIINDCNVFNQYTASIINLKFALSQALQKQFSREIHNGTFTQDHLGGNEFSAIPAQVMVMHQTINRADATREEKLAAIKQCKNNLEPVLGNKTSIVAAAIAFVVVSAIAAVLGAAIGVVLGSLMGSVGSVPGAGAGAFIGFAVGAAKGWTIGGAVAAGLGLGSLASASTLWGVRHNSMLRESLNLVFDNADRSVARRHR